MKHKIHISVLALALAGGWITPVQAKQTPVTATDSTSEIAALRAQIAEMAARLDALQTQLNTTQASSAQAVANAETATQAAKSAQAAADKVKSLPTIKFKGAPEIEAAGGWSFKPRGRLQYDAGFISAPGATGRTDGFGSEARRARLGVEGTMPGGFGYKFEVDFAGNAVDVTDAILSYEHNGLTISAGQQNNFQSMEELTSSRFSSFIERAAFTDAFGFERRVGLSAQYHKDAFLLQGGVFSDNMTNLPGKSWSADGRAVYMPKLGNTQLHFGGSIHYTDLGTGAQTLRYRQRPLVHFTSERFINTGNISAESETGYGAEFAAIHGPLHFAGETFWQKVSRPTGFADPTFFGGYAEIGYFLTKGDTRGYKKGTFDRVKPVKPVGKSGLGALQLVARYDYLDLNDAGVVGGVQNGYQFGIIWTPSDYTRIMANYAIMQYDNAAYAAGSSRSYNVDAFGLRAQIDF